MDEQPSISKAFLIVMENSETLSEEAIAPIAAFVAPFDHETADLICRSSDLIDFRAHSCLVSLASSVLKDMLTLAQAAATGTPDSPSHEPPQEFVDNIPVIPFYEDSSKALLFLLHSCHKFDVDNLPQIESDDLEEIFSTHNKYFVTEFSRAVMSNCLAAAKDDPVAAFALACTNNLEGFRNEVAKLTLEIPIMPFSCAPELRFITGLQYARLLQYHLNCQDVATKIATQDWQWIDSVNNVPLGGITQVCYACRERVNLIGSSIQRGYAIDTSTSAHTQYFFAPKWWYNFMHRTAAEALKERPCGNTLRDRELLEPVLRDAVACQKLDCRTGVRAMVDFCERFAVAVDEAISKVCQVHSPSGAAILMSLVIFQVEPPS